MFDATKEFCQFRAIVGKHARHERRVSKMKQTRVLHIFIMYVGGCEIIVRAWVMQNATVNARRVENDGIRCAGFGADADSIGERGGVICHHLPDDAPEWVCADFGKQAGFNPQPIQRQPRVRDRAARRNLCRADVYQFAWLHEIAERPFSMVGKVWDDV
jgi:hypothetical protein